MPNVKTWTRKVKRTAEDEHDEQLRALGFSKADVEFLREPGVAALWVRILRATLEQLKARRILRLVVGVPFDKGEMPATTAERREARAGVPMTPALTAIAVDVADLVAMLHLLAAAAGERQDEDSRRALRLLARHGERIAEQLEDLAGPLATEPTAVAS